MARTAIIIGQPPLCARLEQQLDLLDERPVTIGWVVAAARDAETIADIASPQTPLLGTVEQLEVIIERTAPDLALITLPAAMPDLVTSIRTRLRRLGVPDRFMPILEDQLEGVGPRTHMDIDPDRLLARPHRLIDEDSVREVIKGKTVLITGAGGSIGSELARIAARYQPRALLLMDRSENALFEIDRQIARQHPRLKRKALLHDVVDAAGTLRHFKTHRPNLVFHAAAHKHVPMMEDHPGEAIDNNLFGTKSVADAAHACDVERFVMISTDKAVNPSSVMGATKRLAEQYVQCLGRESGTECAVVRFGNVLGSSGSVLEIWSAQIADGGPVSVTDARMTRYFMTIPEAAALVIQAATLVDASHESGEVFLLDMGEPVNILELAQRFIRMHGLEPLMPGRDANHFHSGAIEIVTTGVRPGEKLHESLAFDTESMRPTRHPDINIWILMPPGRPYVEDMISRCHRDLRPESPAEIGILLRQLIPEMSDPVAA